MPGHRTIWEEGRHSGPLVARLSSAVTLAVAVLHVLLDTRIGIVFDVAFVAVGIGAALAVRPNDFFAVGVLPPLMLAGTVLVLAVLDRAAVADPRDGVVQALVSGLAHHAGALVTGYGLTLLVLALRQLAARNQGTIRVPHQRKASPVPSQRTPNR